MTLAMNVTYEGPGAHYAPGYLLAVSGLSGVSGADSVLIERHDLTTGVRIDVRGASHAPVTGDTITTTDYEFDFWNDVNGWQYVLNVLDISSNSLATITSSTFSGVQPRTDVLFYPWTSVLLGSIQQPAISVPVIISEFSTWSIPGAVLGTYKVLGRKNPVVLTDTFGGKSGSFVVLSDRGISGVPDDYFIQLITYNDTLQFQPYYDSGNTKTFYFKVTDISAERATQADSVASDVRVSTTAMLYTVNFTEVDRPIADSSVFSVISWQDVLDANATWQDVIDVPHDDWLDVLNNPIA